MQTIVFRGTRADLLAKLRQVPGIITGRIADPTGTIQEVKERMGMALLTKIQDAYQIKSEHGTDEMGIQWKELSPVTLALRRVNMTKKARERQAREFQFLPDATRFRIRRLQRDIENVFLGRTKKGREHQQHARKILNAAWKAGRISKTRFKEVSRALSGKMRKEQAETRAFIAAHVEILKDNGDLYRSFGPNLRGGGDQRLETGPGYVQVGTNVSYHKYHNSSLPRKLKKDGTPKLPRRQTLPDAQKPMPKSWWDATKEALASGLRLREFWARILA